MEWQSLYSITMKWQSLYSISVEWQSFLFNYYEGGTGAGSILTNPTPSTLHPQPSTLHPAPATLHPQPYTLNPTPSTPHLQPYTFNPKPATLHPQKIVIYTFFPRQEKRTTAGCSRLWVPRASRTIRGVPFTKNQGAEARFRASCVAQVCFE